MLTTLLLALAIAAPPPPRVCPYKIAGCSSDDDPCRDGQVLTFDEANNRHRCGDPAIGAARLMETLVDPGATTLSKVGYGASITQSGTCSNADDAAGPWISCATTSTAGTSAGLFSPFTLFRRDWTIDYTTTLETGADVTSVRLWAGLFSGDPRTSSTPSVHLAAFRYDTGADGTAFWRACTDSATGTPTCVATATPVAASTAHLARIRLDASQADFWLDGILVHTETATLPTATQLLGWVTGVTTLTSSARSVSFGRNAIRHR